MTKHSQEFNRLVNPVKLADDTILALSSIQRVDGVSPELLRVGIELCDYMKALIDELNAPEESREQLTFRTFRNDRKALQDSGIDIMEILNKVLEVKVQINNLIKDPFHYTKEEIESIQEFIMTMTMPMWQNRTLEFRERKLKRGLIIHG